MPTTQNTTTDRDYAAEYLQAAIDAHTNGTICRCPLAEARCESILDAAEAAGRDINAIVIDLEARALATYLATR